METRRRLSTVGQVRKRNPSTIELVVGLSTKPEVRYLAVVGEKW